jgi:hypothetical protein
MIQEIKLRKLIRQIIYENTTTYRGGKHSQYFSGGDPAFNIPEIEGVNVDVFRSNNDVHASCFSVTIDVEERPDLKIHQDFKDEEEARNFARKYMEFIKSIPQN